MKERNWGTVISIAVHLCAISFLMVPSFIVQSRPFNVVMVDFSLAENPSKILSTPNGKSTMIKKRQLLLKNKKMPREMNGPDRPVDENPETVPIKEQCKLPDMKTVATTLDTPDETAIHSTSGNLGETSIGIPSAVQEESILGGVAKTYVSYSEPADTVMTQSGSVGDVAGSGQADGQYQESLVEGSEDYNYIRDAVMKNINYPDRARRLGLEGKVLLSFIVLENGTTSEIEVVNSSCHRILDESAKEAVAGVRIAGKVGYRVAVRLPIAYRLQRTKDGRI